MNPQMKAALNQAIQQSNGPPAQPGVGTAPGGPEMAEQTCVCPQCGLSAPESQFMPQGESAPMDFKPKKPARQAAPEMDASDMDEED